LLLPIQHQELPREGNEKKFPSADKLNAVVRTDIEAAA
jgi:hypothetical protein